MPIVGGLDLAGSPKRPSGLVILDTLSNTILYAGIVYDTEKIVNTITAYTPTVIAIDSPLSHSQRGYRLVDIELKRRGYRVLPPSWRGMKMLVDRALVIMKRLVEKNIAVIETHPRSALKSSRCETIWDLLVSTGIKGLPQYLPKDVADAAISAVVAKFYVEGRAVYISASDGIVYLLPPLCGDSE